MDYLTGKCLKATKSLSLSYRIVDGHLYTVSNFYTPKIQPGNYLLVKSVDKDIVTLQNLSSDDWVICELTLEDIEDFKIVSRDSI